MNGEAFVDTNFGRSMRQVIEDNPLLSAEKEKELAAIMQKFKTGKQKAAAREKLFNSNIRLVLDYVFRHNFLHLPIQDLINSGMIGLGIAVDRFDGKRGLRFSTFAYSWIRLYVQRQIRAQIQRIHIPANVVENARKLHEVSEKHKLSDKALMRHLKVSEKALKKAKIAKQVTDNSVLSLDYEYEKDGDNPTSLRETVPDRGSWIPDTLAAESDKFSKLHEALKTLDPMSQEVIKARFFGNDNGYLATIGKKHNLSKERIRQIQQKAFKMLRFRLNKTMRGKNEWCAR